MKKRTSIAIPFQADPRRAAFVALASIGFGLLGACSGGGSAGDPGPASLSVAITDASSDQIESFVVDVAAVDLKKVGGAVVGVVRAPVTVDLATLSDTSQFLSALNVPKGDYESATITLDFTNASCVLVGQSVPAAILDDNGLPLTGQVVMPMQFGSNPLNAIGGRNRLLEFDFDLDESVSVDSVANSVSVEPTIVMRIDPTTKSVVADGTLVSVDVASHTFIGDMTTVHGVSLGNITVEVSPTTVFQVDGNPDHGSIGLAELNAKPAGTWIQITGDIDTGAPGLRAKDVYAGTGTYNGGTDIVEGHIIDRSGSAGASPTLTVLGHSNNADHSIFQFNTTFTVNASFASTKVVRAGSAHAYSTDNLDVGQRVRVFGTLSGTTMDATANSDVIRQQQTRVYGDALGAVSAGTLTMNLNRVDWRLENRFTWADGGTSPADPDAFTVAAGTLGNGLAVGAGTPVMARGFFSAVDDNNQDLGATSLSNLALAPSHLLVKNRPNGFTVAATTSSTDIQLAITGTATIGEKAIINYGFAGPNDLPNAPTPTIVPAASTGLYVIHDKATGSFTVYLHFSDFSAAFGAALGSGATLQQIGATGVYDPATNTIRAAVSNIVIE